MNVIEKIRHKLNRFEISTKISLGYSGCFILLLVAINAAMWIGIIIALFTPAEKTIRFSMQQIEKIWSELETDYNNYDPRRFHNVLVAGVVLRVVNDKDELVIDTDENYPSIEMFYDGLLKDPPIFADENFEVAKVNHALIYCAQMTCMQAGKPVTLYFFRTITSELKVFDRLAQILIALDILGIIAALIVGRILSQRVLKPIKTMNDLAREIAFEKMEGRIPLRETDDELNELAKTFNEMLDRLQVAINKQRKFVSDASHELRTPAAVIKGYIDFIEGYGTADEALLRENLQVIGSEARNMQDLLENLLFLSRTDQNRQKLNKKILDLDDIVGDVMSKMKTVIKTHTVELVRNQPVKIFGDETTIRQMIRIFLDNAVKYTPVGGKISVASTVDDKKISLSISDTGIGIAEENLDKIFERFIRIDSEDLVSEVKGSGLGLSIAKWIADSHDIKISVDSELGKGTTFTLTIPVAD